jgi:hypothetical protein
MRKTGNAGRYETNTEVDVLLWEVPPTARKPDAALHRCIPDTEQLMAQHVLIAVEVLSTWSGRRDRGPAPGYLAELVAGLHEGEAEEIQAAPMLG